MTQTKTDTQTPTSRRRFESTYGALVRKTLRVPAIEPSTTSLFALPSRALAIQLDSALLKVGFKLSGELLDHLAARQQKAVRDTSQMVLDAVRELVGDHVAHNVYFIDFPKNVPDTMEFWVACIADVLENPSSRDEVAADLSAGFINLLALPKYGRYQHTYEEMLAAHDELIPSLKDRVTILELGESLVVESRRLYFQLAGSRLPLGVDDLSLLRTLADVHFTDGNQPGEIPVRENRAEINRARIAHDMPILVDTPIDVLRLAASLSDGDVSLAVPARLRSFRRAERRVLMTALDASVTRDYKLGDVPRYREQFKRLGERLHPHEYPLLQSAQDVFRVARREKAAASIAGRVDLLLAAGQLAKAIKLLSQAPGLLIRNVDYLLRLAQADPGGLGAYEETLLTAVSVAAEGTSTRVLLSLREHLQNRTTSDAARVFVNRQGRAWVTADERAPLDSDLTRRLCAILDDVIPTRLPRAERLVLDPMAANVAVPLSEKTKPKGFGVLPRGSVVPVSNQVRFFVYWKERHERTDYDLSVLLLNEQYEEVGQVSFTNLSTGGAVHSGDITESHNGASEFIDVDLNKTVAKYVIPQINIYSGEGFDEVEEVFFGFMDREEIQRGRPFEPRTVRMKSDLFGAGRTALPLAFAWSEDGWTAKWMHLTLRGYANLNSIETNRLSTGLLMRSIVERRYLTLGTLVSMMGENAWPTVFEEPVTYVGLDRPEGLPEGSTTFTPLNFSDLLGHTESPQTGTDYPRLLR